MYREDLPLGILSKLPNDAVVTLDLLKDHNIVRKSTKDVKFYLSGEVKSVYKVSSTLKMTKGAKKLLESSGGELIEE